MSFVNKVVLVTGGGGGIGAVTAEVFAKECASVAIASRSIEELKKVVKRCEEHGAAAFAIKADMTKDEETDTVVKKTIDKFGRLDVLVNNLGIMREANILTDHFLKTFEEVWNVNMRTAVRVTYFAAPHLIKTKGNIINVSSMAAITTTRPSNIAYRTSKAAMNHFTRSAALDLAPYGVRVNAVSPGPVRTNLYKGMKMDLEIMKSNTALKQLAEPIDIANMILYIAGDTGRIITGSNFVLDSGSCLNYMSKGAKD